jgi:hypothetical protein
MNIVKAIMVLSLWSGVNAIQAMSRARYKDANPAYSLVAARTFDVDPSYVSREDREMAARRAALEDAKNARLIMGWRNTSNQVLYLPRELVTNVIDFLEPR